ncbi:bifunctional tRNA (5-methylaminomethyl-2-thiouridine)(34)-methyltransferase MnmD/FAD-dependent 5-carboxymethylaminomethyl-2-thiouridine(34) oxidoreductase MnmC [Colwellia sp. 4_MG-2023]|uniref:bifunctional tRNA (5-methylaminomethyl-2-thiouridine)(34)-methyltransferase MnmD/FAD-dependent 5-carboxymethylaminomethyl-2-thiouridine(34) oxidoreductase MnmC n=1 Tax=unclassified Colwellia TaxID=196834 RepID=UPI0026E16A9B|nr:MULTISPECIES: bifunctional tRNA (5-methylaminomethyl-2-thiouridine)(34)-methyltransferase MnmD/FAD-dependent 5-carboxymethylaminomethyl-2-thiouridine(34) oxidoreductase MnmC [unclassified Colwellia]MDO6508431.1 bifunctional tRNA (5-methylaminomethyl-2-thiouridine)(34)-methyltransferase MnmD/FAD-dependent 5-carboxymethylaminomethyl-2-thiouridine(34) oxidoreductase MnmC [Colwellia sp. 5_MG-2023]MDO6557082.1 bifunctional tRNA (5-methylaminomethyl-2-thiouridine)(34)-methyltransferase MnmD/FAD-depe
MKKPVRSSPELSFQQDGTPYSKQFTDIYFDSESGYQQSEQVFLLGNNISDRIKHKDDRFVIMETGFGTGLNFLLTLQAYHKLLQEVTDKELPELSFISVEKFPLTKQQLVKSLQALPQLTNFSNLLLAQYPELSCDNDNVEEFSLSFFNNKVTLTVIINDATKGLSNLNPLKNDLADAWYLDGFSPAKNPEMWSKALFEQIARLSKPEASIATFTVAGFVKRQMQDVGFRTQKTACIGNKHEMLTGVFQQNPYSKKGYQLRSIITKPQHVSIIGGGIASACAALALTKQGIKVTIYCKDNSLAQGASSNAIGALYPLLHQQADDISLFYQQAFWRAKTLYNTIIEDGFSFPHQWCGLLEIAYKEALEKRQQKFNELATWPTKLIHRVDANKASELANIELTHGGLFMPHAGWISPQDAVKQIINAAKATGRLKVENNILVNKIKKIETGKPNNSHQKNWTLLTNKGEFDACVVVFCGGAEIIDFDWVKQLPFSSVQGQVTNMNTNESISDLSTVICHKGYLTPQHNNMHAIGATFNKDCTRTTTTSEEDQFNLNMLSTCLPELTQKIGWDTSDIARSKSRLRCMTPDHMPIVGAMPDIEKHIEIYPHLAKDKNWKYDQIAPVIDNLYVMMGFGARGLCSAPLAADILAADLCATPYPVDNEMLFNLSPNRFVIRDIIRRKI